MTKQILQIENTTNEAFKNEILGGVKNMLSDLVKQDKDDEILLTREATAKLLDISLVTLWKYTKNSIIPAFRIGSKVRYKKSDVLNALEKMNQFN